MHCGGNNFPAEVCRLRKRSKGNRERRGKQCFPFCFAVDLLTGSKINGNIIFTQTPLPQAGFVWKTRIPQSESSPRKRSQFNKLAVIYRWVWAAPAGPALRQSPASPVPACTSESLPTILIPPSSRINPPFTTGKGGEYLRSPSDIFYLYTVPRCYRCWELLDTFHNGVKSFSGGTEWLQRTALISPPS